MGPLHRFLGSRHPYPSLSALRTVNQMTSAKQSRRENKNMDRLAISTTICGNPTLQGDAGRNQILGTTPAVPLVFFSVSPIFLLNWDHLSFSFFFFFFRGQQEQNTSIFFYHKRTWDLYAHKLQEGFNNKICITSRAAFFLI